MFKDNPFRLVEFVFLIFLSAFPAPCYISVKAEMRFQDRYKMRKPKLDAKINACQSIQAQPQENNTDQPRERSIL